MFRNMVSVITYFVIVTQCLQWFNELKSEARRFTLALLIFTMSRVLFQPTAYWST